MSRTRNYRNDRDRAPITIEARSATRVRDPLTQDPLDLRPACQVIGLQPVGRDEAAEVHDPPHAGSGRSDRKPLGRLAFELCGSGCALPASIEWIR